METCNDTHCAHPSRQHGMLGLWRWHEDRLAGTKEERTFLLVFEVTGVHIAETSGKSKSA